MTKVIKIEAADWNGPRTRQLQEEAHYALEAGNVLLFPQLRFRLAETETHFLSPTTAGKSKNVSLNITNGELRGSNYEPTEMEPLKNMMARFAQHSKDFLLQLLPRYELGLIQARTSFRPMEIAGRSTSWRKDDTRLHVDSFPSSPVQDKRILRIFSNVNPQGQSRSWRLGESFEKVAARFLPSLSRPIFGSSQLLRLCQITKSRRSAYDHLMLQLHDCMKADLNYQSQADQIAYDFPPGSTWIVFTDQVSHAAMAGRYALEQTFYLPVTSMMDESKSPLRTLERLTQRKLI